MNSFSITNQQYLSCLDVMYACATFDEELRISTKVKGADKLANHITPISNLDLLKKASQQPDAAIAFVLPASETLVLNVNVPLSSKKKALQVLPSMLDVQLPFPLEHCIFKVIHLEKMPDDTYRFTVVVAKRSIIEKYLKWFHNKGIELQAMYSEVALSLSIAQEIYPKGEKSVIINLEEASISLVVVEEDTVKASYAFKLNNTISERDLNQWIKRIAKAENLASQCYNFVLIGKETKSKLANEILSKLALDQKVNITTHPAAEFAITHAACSLSSSSKHNTLNFLEDEYESEKVRTLKNKMASRRLLIIASAALFLILINFFHIGLCHLKQKEIDTEIASLTQKILPETSLPKGMELFEINRKMQQHLEKTITLQEIVENYVLSVFSKVTTNLIRKNILISNLSINDQQILVTGSTANWKDCEELANLFKDQGYTVALEKKPVSTFNTQQFIMKLERKKKQDATHNKAE